MFDLAKIIKCLAQERPVFHSEADFQHALAWKIHEMHGKLKVRLEYPLEHSSKQAHVDIILLGGHNQIALEIKYKTRSPKKDIVINGEQFKLKDQSAQGSGRYDFWKDTSRLEQLVECNEIAQGFTIFLTNDKSYWDGPRKETNDWEFRLIDGLKVDRKCLSWPQNLIKTTINNSVLSRKTPIKISGCYELSWMDYSGIQINSDAGNARFKYLMLNVRL